MGAGQNNFIGVGLGAIQLTVSAGADVAQGTYYGYETAIAFAASASVASGDDGSLTHAWTVQTVPEGSSVVTGDITSPTSLTGATLAGWDYPGWYTLRLTTTRASDGSIAVSDRHIYVGTAEGYFLITDLDFTACASRDVKALGDVAVTWNDGVCSLTLTQSGSAGLGSCADTPGTGLVATGSAVGGAYWEMLGTISALYGHTGRTGTYVLIMDATSAGFTAGNVSTAINLWNAAKTKRYFLDNGYSAVPDREYEGRNSAQSSVGGISPNQAKTYRFRLRGQDVTGWLDLGSMAAEPVIDGGTPFTAGGPNLDAVDPGATAGHNWSTDLLGIMHYQSNAGATRVSTFTRLVLAWKP